MAVTLAETREAVGALMQAIQSHFKPGTRITVMVRTPAFPDRDFVMTDDDLREAIAMLQRSRERERIEG